MCSVVVDKRWHVNGRTENEKRQSSDNLEKERDGTTVVLEGRTRASYYARGTNDKNSWSRDEKVVVVDGVGKDCWKLCRANRKAGRGRGACFDAIGTRKRMQVWKVWEIYDAAPSARLT